LSSPPRFHLVAVSETAEAWRGFFKYDQPVEIVPPLPPPELAALHCPTRRRRRPAHQFVAAGIHCSYRQAFIDRLWMRGVGAVLMIYIALAAAYIGWVQFANGSIAASKKEVGRLSLEYTNTLQIKERLRVLQDQMDLQFAALDSYKAIAEFLPPELTLNQSILIAAEN